MFYEYYVVHWRSLKKDVEMPPTSCKGGGRRIAKSKTIDLQLLLKMFRCAHAMSSLSKKKPHAHALVVEKAKKIESKRGEMLSEGKWNSFRKEKKKKKSHNAKTGGLYFIASNNYLRPIATTTT